MNVNEIKDKISFLEEWLNRLDNDEVRPLTERLDTIVSDLRGVRGEFAAATKISGIGAEQCMTALDELMKRYKALNDGIQALNLKNLR